MLFLAALFAALGAVLAQCDNCIFSTPIEANPSLNPLPAGWSAAGVTFSGSFIVAPSGGVCSVSDLAHTLSAPFERFELNTTAPSAAGFASAQLTFGLTDGTSAPNNGAVFAYQLGSKRMLVQQGSSNVFLAPGTLMPIDGAFHNYTIVWSSSCVQFYIDGAVVATYSGSFVPTAPIWFNYVAMNSADQFELASMFLDSCYLTPPPCQGCPFSTPIEAYADFTAVPTDWSTTGTVQIGAGNVIEIPAGFSGSVWDGTHNFTASSQRIEASANFPTNDSSDGIILGFSENDNSLLNLAAFVQDYGSVRCWVADAEYVFLAQTITTPDPTPFHNYTIVWSANCVEFYVDSVLVASYNESFTPDVPIAFYAFAHLNDASNSPFQLQSMSLDVCSVTPPTAAPTPAPTPVPTCGGVCLDPASASQQCITTPPLSPAVGLCEMDVNGSQDPRCFLPTGSGSDTIPQQISCSLMSICTPGSTCTCDNAPVNACYCDMASSYTNSDVLCNSVCSGSCPTFASVNRLNSQCTQAAVLGSCDYSGNCVFNHLDAIGSVTTASISLLSCVGNHGTLCFAEATSCGCYYHNSYTNVVFDYRCGQTPAPTRARAGLRGRGYCVSM